MPWYFSGSRFALAAFYGYIGYTQFEWIRDSEQRYERSLAWRPAVATVLEHKVVFNRLGASQIRYRFEAPDGTAHEGDRFRSGGIYKEDYLENSRMAQVGHELVVHYNPADPSENAVKIASDRPMQCFFAFNVLLCAIVAYRSLRCEAVFPNMFHRFLSVKTKKQPPQRRPYTGSRPSGRGQAR
jgi:hypothetical protein